MDKQYIMSFFFRIEDDTSAMAMNGNFNIECYGNGWFRCWGRVRENFANDFPNCIENIISNYDYLDIHSAQIEEKTMYTTYTIEDSPFHGPIKWYRLDRDGFYDEVSAFYRYYLYGNEVSKEEWKKHELVIELSGVKDEECR